MLVLSLVLVIITICHFLSGTSTEIPPNSIFVNAMDPPSFDGILKADEWKKATHLTINFTFENGETHRADIYLGHDDEAFFVGAIIWNVGPNPYSVPDGWWYPDVLVLFFDTDNDGNLTTPEDGKAAYIVIGIEKGREEIRDAWVGDWYWNSSDYYAKLMWKRSRPNLNTEAYWNNDDTDGGDHHSISNVVFKYFNNSIVGYNPLDGTQYFEFGFELDPKEDTSHDGLHVKPGELKVVGLCIEYYRQLGFNDTTPVGPDIYDDWPGEGYTPDVFVNATKYAKIVIDLRKRFPFSAQQLNCLQLISILWLLQYKEGLKQLRTYIGQFLMKRKAKRKLSRDVFSQPQSFICIFRTRPPKYTVFQI